jgi:hypothetical protein
MKTYEDGLRLHAFLNSALGGSERLYSRSGEAAWEAGYTRSEEKKLFFPTEKWTPFF